MQENDGLSGTLIEVMEPQSVYVDKSARGRVLAFGSFGKIIIHSREKEHPDDRCSAYCDKALGSNHAYASV
jgi:hypothetical protein